MPVGDDGSMMGRTPDSLESKTSVNDRLAFKLCLLANAWVHSLLVCQELPMYEGCDSIAEEFIPDGGRQCSGSHDVQYWPSSS